MPTTVTPSSFPNRSKPDVGLSVSVFGDAGNRAIHATGRLFPTTWEYEVPVVGDTIHRFLHIAGAEFYALGKALDINVEQARGPGDVLNYEQQPYEPWKEIAALIISLGEGAMLSALAAVEVTAAWDYIDRIGLDDSNGQARVVATRTSFLNEATQQHLISLGHQLANLALRFFMTAPGADAAIAASTKAIRQASNVMQPWSDDLKAWIFQSDLESLRKGLVGSRIRSATVVRQASWLGRQSEWKRLNQSRGRAFHRWREDRGGVRAGSMRSMRDECLITSDAGVTAAKAMWRVYDALKKSAPRVGGTSLVPHFFGVETPCFAAPPEPERP